MMPYIVEAIQEQNGDINRANNQLANQGLRLDSISEELKALTSRVDEHDGKIDDQQQQIDELKQKVEELEAVINSSEQVEDQSSPSFTDRIKNWLF